MKQKRNLYRSKFNAGSRALFFLFRHLTSDCDVDQTNVQRI